MKQHALISPSAAHRWLNCPKAPRLEATLPKKVSIYANEGILAHKACEIAAKYRFHMVEMFEYRQVIERLKQDPLWKDEMSQTADLYSTYLAYRAGVYKGRAKPEFEVKVDISEYVPESFGRCDCLIHCGSKNLIVVDYKHGKGLPIKAKENPQLMLYALGALASYELKNIKKIEFGIVQPRINYFGAWKCTTKKLLEWGESIKPKAQMAYEGKGEFNSGSWCRFCRANGICEATKGVYENG